MRKDKKCFKKMVSNSKEKKHVFFCRMFHGGTTAFDNEVEKFSMDDRSSLSVSGGILPSLGARSHRKAKLRPFTISPFDSRYRLFYLFSCIYDYGVGFLKQFYELIICEFGYLFLCMVQQNRV